MRDAALPAHPQVRDILNNISQLPDNATMQKLNVEVEKNKEEPRDAALKTAFHYVAPIRFIRGDIVIQ
ncbi:glycine betaine ABC transporter substrate-binding protein [Citrobacter koseri]|uniref:glycine betaine ABC transporter substrate-binding protein n=1 Tax=Citrobacter koseri TaxID=545 RepID=UPI0024B85D00|nr:glycine betaine ABC transporter substrate-binding protein [Citrobacter koseri]MDI9801426.1 glycine betaine ABC transporter substrate-binding protein [Citrobacter koseri]